MTEPKITNQLLLALSKADRALLSRKLEPVALEVRDSIEKANAPIKHVYFPDSGIISVVVKSGGAEIEAGIVGREGMTGTAVLLGNHRSPCESYVQMAGSAHRISAVRLRSAFASSKTLGPILRRYAQVFMVQVIQTAFANGRAQIEARLARWLLMAHDRQEADELNLTHEFLAVMLGVRRAGVTNAISALERKGLIGAKRSSIHILNRKGLLKEAADTYGVPEKEYARLIG